MCTLETQNLSNRKGKLFALTGFKGGGISVCWLNEKRPPKS